MHMQQHMLNGHSLLSCLPDNTEIEDLFTLLLGNG